MLRPIIHVPESATDDIVAFTKLPLGDLERAVSWLCESSPKQDVETLAEECEKATGVSFSDSESIISVAVNISRLRRKFTESEDQIVSRFTESVSSHDILQGDDLEEFSKRQHLLVRLIAVDQAIDIMSKARELLYEFQLICLDASVFTDVRHVYNNSATEICGGLIIHNLGLEYMDGGDFKEIHISLTLKHIKDLIAQLERAQQKTETAKELLDKQGIPELTPNL